MSNKREAKLWREISWRDLLLAVFVTIALIIGYFYVARLDLLENVIREFLLSIISNLIPTPLLFIIAYILFHKLEELRSERDADEIADKVVLRLIEIAKIQTSTTGENTNFLEGLPEISDLYLKITHELEITKKAFDYKSKQQKLVIEFTNRGSNVIQMKKITYSDMTFGLPKAMLSKSYRVDEGRDYLIPVDNSQAEILPDGKYTINILLDGKHDADKINAWVGKWGYLHLELIYGTDTENVQYSI